MNQVMTSRTRWIAFSLLAATAFVLILDAAIVNVALPSIAKDFDAAQEDLSWVTNAYALAFGGFLLLGGRLADLLGRRRMFIIGLILFTTASLVGALSQSVNALVAARAAQGFGAAIVTPAALSLILTLFEPGPTRNKALGIWGAVAGSGAAAGSVLGGVLTEWWGWQAVLWVNVPIGILALFLAPRLLPEARDPQGARAFDFAGAATITAGLGLLVYTLVEANDAQWVSVQTIGLGALALALIASFLAIESRTKRPLVPLRTFRIAGLRTANIIGLVGGMTMFPMFFILTLYMQQVLNMEPIEAGLGQLPVAIMFMIGAGPVAKLVTRIGPKAPMVVGLVIMGLGIAWLSRMSSTGSWLGDIAVPTVVAGIGATLIFIPVTIAATSGVGVSDTGLASGLMTTTQQIGGALGLAIAVALATAGTNQAVESGVTNPFAARTDGFQLALLVLAGITLAGAVIAALLMPRGHIPQISEPVPVEAEAKVEGEPQPAAITA